MTTDQIILMGWKDICCACGVKDERTMRRLAEKYKMPVFKMDGRPTMVKNVLSEWWLNIQKMLYDAKEAPVYFIKTEDDFAVKIGVSVFPENRLKDIQKCCPVKLILLGTAEGGTGLEGKIHRKLSRHRIHGEWFYLNESVNKLIQSHLNSTE